jgi:hypothetical protein
MFYVGLDLGQRQDHTAIAVVERREAWQDPMLVYPRVVYPGLDVRGIARVPLGTSYPGVVSQVQEILNQDSIRGRCCLVVDGTGVGAPVVDLLRAARLGCEISAVTITGGEHANGNRSVNGVQRWNVPKRDLIAGVQVLLEKGELRIARRLREAGALVRELSDIRATTKNTGRMKLGADGCGEHDDLVIAVALACWRANRGMSGFGEGRLPGI